MSLKNMKPSALSLMVAYLLIQSVSSIGVQGKCNCVQLHDSNECDHRHCQQCNPLMWYVNRTGTFNGTCLLFSEGSHTLSDNTLMKMDGISDFNMTGNCTNPKLDPSYDIPILTTKVVCRSNAGFLFNNSNLIFIQKLQFEGCGINTEIDIYNRSAVRFHSCSNINLYQVVIKNSFGFALVVLNMFGKCHILQSEFVQSTKKSLELSWNTIFHFNNSDARDINLVSVLIQKSHFSNASNGVGLCLMVHQPSVSIILSKVIVKNSTNSNIVIDMLSFHNNSSSVSIHDSVVEKGEGHYGGGLYIIMKYSNKNKHGYGMGENVVTINNTIFQGNSANSAGGGVHINYNEHVGGHINITLQIIFNNCTFKNNSARTGAALHVAKHSVPLYSQRIIPQFVVIFNNCHVEKNHLKSYPEQTNEDGAFDIFGVKDVRIIDTTFTDNRGTALLIVNSAVQFENQALFKGNRAPYGGAIKICQGSVLILKEHTHIKFQSNRAFYAGGAIYAGKECLQVAPPCFFQPDTNIPDISQFKSVITLEFINNTAGIAGSAIYGGSVDDCFTYSMLSKNGTDKPSYYNSFSLYRQIFIFSGSKSSSNVSLVTSDPYGICFCNPLSTKQPDCNKSRIDIITGKFAGEWFSVSVSAVGQTGGSVPALILASKHHDKDNNFSISSIPYSSAQSNNRALKEPCQTLHLAIAILSKRYNENFTVVLGVRQSNLVSERSSYYNLPKLKLNVSLIPCPWLFRLNSTYQCDCSNLSKYRMMCDINTMTITKSKKENWIGCQNSNTTNSTYYDDTCERIMVSQDCCGHCSNVSMLNSSSLDHQCISGRTGMACSRCKDDYALSLGRSECIPKDIYCSSWKTVSLLLAFSLAGLLFVCFIAVFNFTVSEGTAHGLLFYANLVHAYRQSIFPNENPKLLVDLLRIFIAWLNLDFGFEVCFYAGMDAYQKIWLEFAFLFYMLVLGLLIIYASHKYIRVTRLVGRNVVGVLSTIMLFSYSKLVGTSVKALSFTYLEIYMYNSSEIPQTIRVWREDATINYFQGKHIPLAIVAILLCAISLFYTLSLLFIQCLQRRSNWFILRWVEKLRPFFDANTGPCRDNYRFWPGFLLFLRFILLFLNIYDVRHCSNQVNLYTLLAFCVIMFLLACVSPHGMYKKWPLNILEFSFYLNLGILSSLVVTFQNGFPSPIVFTAPSVGIFAMTFFGVLVYHCYKRVSGTHIWKRCRTRVQRRGSNQDPYSIIQEDGSDVQNYNERDVAVFDEQSPISQRMPPIIRYDQLREPLLVSTQ